jgi:hypothetical protein
VSVRRASGAGTDHRGQLPQQSGPGLGVRASRSAGRGTGPCCRAVRRAMPIPLPPMTTGTWLPCRQAARRRAEPAGEQRRRARVHAPSQADLAPEVIPRGSCALREVPVPGLDVVSARLAHRSGWQPRAEPHQHRIEGRRQSAWTLRPARASPLSTTVTPRGGRSQDIPA